MLTVFAVYIPELKLYGTLHLGQVHYCVDQCDLKVVKMSSIHANELYK